MGGLTSRTPHATLTPRLTDRGGGKRLISKDKSRLGKREKGCSEPAESESGAEAGASGHERAREKEREREREGKRRGTRGIHDEMEVSSVLLGLCFVVWVVCRLVFL